MRETRPKTTTVTCSRCKQRVEARLRRAQFVLEWGTAYSVEGHDDTTTGQPCWGSGTEVDWMPSYSPDF